MVNVIVKIKNKDYICCSCSKVSDVLALQMSNLLKKSEENYHIAVYLKDERKCFNPTIHCWYYSCIQMLTYIIIDIFKESKKSIKNETQYGKGGSHSVLIKKIHNDLKGRNRRDAFAFDSKINSLKALRIKADYEDVLISENQANYALKYTNELRRILKKYYAV